MDGPTCKVVTRYHIPVLKTLPASSTSCEYEAEEENIMVWARTMHRVRMRVPLRVKILKLQQAVIDGD